MSMIKCLECEWPISDRVSKCPHCGKQIPMSAKYPNFYEKSNNGSTDADKVNIIREEKENEYINESAKKFCQHCGSRIDKECVVCPKCGKQVSILQNNYNNPRTDNITFGRELGIGIKESLKGLNTMASPKSKKTCIILSLFPIFAMLFIMIGGAFQSDFITGLSVIPIFLSGSCQFYVGKFKKGLIYTFTCGLFCFGALADIFSLIITGTFKDANGFPVIY